MEEEKSFKSHNFVVIITLLLIVFFGTITYIKFNGDNNVAEKDGKENITKSFSKIVYRTKVSNNTFFSEKILESADEYIAENVDLDTIEDQIEIDATDIIDMESLDEKYQKCTGKMILTPLDDAYSYTISSSCDNNADESYTIEYTKSKLDYNSNAPILEPVSDGYIGYMGTDNYTSSANVSYQNAIIVKFDENGVLEWGTKYGDDLTDGFNKTSRINYFRYFEMEDGYLVFGKISIEKGSKFVEKYGLGEVTLMQKYAKDGTLISEQLFPYEELGMGSTFKYFKGDNGNYFFSLNDKVIEITASGEIKNKTPIINSTQELMRLDAMDTDGYYFYDYYEPIMYKYDKEGNKVWEVNVQDNNDTGLFSIRNIYVFNGKLVIDVTGKVNNDDIFIYDFEGNFIKKFNYDKIKINDETLSFRINKVYKNENSMNVMSQGKNYVLIDEINADLNFESRNLFDNVNSVSKLGILYESSVEYSMIGNNGFIKYYFSGNGNIGFCKYIVSK